MLLNRSTQIGAIAGFVSWASGSAATHAQMLEGCDQIHEPEITVESCTAMIDDPGTGSQALVTALINRGIALTYLGQHAAAIADLDQAAELAPNDYRVYHNRAAANGSMWAPFEAQLQDLSRVIELRPDSAFAHDRRGGTLYLMGEFDRAFDDFNRAVELDPTYPMGYLGRATISAERGDYENMTTDLARGTDLDPAGLYSVFLIECRPGHVASAVVTVIDLLESGLGDIGEVQQYLSDTGYHAGEATGAIDTETEQALRRWLEDNCP